MKKLYSMYFDCGRMGSLEGLFVADDLQLTSILGSDLYFGEVLGKHSDISGILEEGDISIISEDQDKIEWLVEVMAGNTISGYNPFDYIQEPICDECGEEMEYCECTEDEE